MNVGSYIFQSPYSSQVQVGRPDPSAKSEESQSSTTQSSAGSFTAVNSTAQEAQTFKATQVSEVKPAVESTQLLDIYA